MIFSGQVVACRCAPDPSSKPLLLLCSLAIASRSSKGQKNVRRLKTVTCVFISDDTKNIEQRNKLEAAVFLKLLDISAQVQY